MLVTSFSCLHLMVVAAALGEVVAPGVTFTVHTLPDPNVVHVLAVERDRPEYRLDVGWPQAARNFTQREGTTVIASRYERPPHEDVVAAVNASFFGPTPEINGATASRGEMLEAADGKRETLVVGRDGALRIEENLRHGPGRLMLADGSDVELRQCNAFASPNTITAYTPAWGRVDGRTACAGETGCAGLTAVVVEGDGPEARLPDDRPEAGPTSILDGPEARPPNDRPEAGPTHTHDRPEAGLVERRRGAGGARMSQVHTMCGTVSAVLLDAAAVETAVPAGGMVLVAGPDMSAAVRGHVAEGDRVCWRFGSPSRALDDVEMAVSGVGWLVREGEPYTRNWKQYAFAKVRHPRTVVAWNDAFVYLIVIDGRSKQSRGVTFEEMATFLIHELGVCEAINLDGGGSSTMVVDGLIRNAPSDGYERPVANAVMLVRRDAEAAP